MNTDLGSDRFAEAWPPDLVEALFAEAREARRTAAATMQASRELKRRRRGTQRRIHRVLFEARRQQLRRRAIV
ncbi:MAG TPA: hypothetical protein VFJ24_07405 [Gaiellales bacterium]|nr:hypothetical protein [Gaiellales bacterium]